MLRLFENISIKHYNPKVDVPNTASTSKGILFHVSKFLEKVVFQFMFEIVKRIGQFQPNPQTFPNYLCQVGQKFLTRTSVF